MSNLPSSHAGGAPGHRVGAIIVAAGRSSRMGGVDKLFLPLLGLPLLSYSLEAFHEITIRGIEALDTLEDKGDDVPLHLHVVDLVGQEEAGRAAATVRGAISALTV